MQSPLENILTSRKTDSAINNCVIVCNVFGSCQEGSTSINVLVRLHHENNPNCQVILYTSLDLASNGTSIKRQTLKKLGIEAVKTHFHVNPIRGIKVNTKQKVAGLKVEDPERITQVELLKVC